MLAAIVAEDLNTTFRNEVGDPLEGVSADEPDSENLWSNAEIYGYMTEAADALARDTKRLMMQVITRDVIANQPTLRLPPHVVDIRSARLLTARRQLRATNLNETDFISDDYGTNIGVGSVLETSGTPFRFVQDYYGKGVLRIIPTPTANDTIELQCSVTISYPYQTGAEPLHFTEIRDQRTMLMYMKYLAYRKQDADGRDTTRSDEFGALYQKMAHEREYEILRTRFSPRKVRFSW